MDFKLSQNFPNPFNPSTEIRYHIPKLGLVKLKIYDVLGREVEMLVNENQTAGSHKVTFNSTKLASGVYFYKIYVGDFSEIKKMTLVK